MKEYTIEKDAILKRWIIWKAEGNAKFEVYRATTKKECEKHLNKLKKKAD